jgi:hypothetical protein
VNRLEASGLGVRQFLKAVKLEEPPFKSMVFTLASAKKPSARLSGDQNGKIASSVPGRECASSEFIGRTQI